jgi:hypothetical protein
MPLTKFKLYDVAVSGNISIKANNDEEAQKLAREYYKEDVGRLDMTLTARDGLENVQVSTPVAVPVLEATPVIEATPVVEGVTPEPIG